LEKLPPLASDVFTRSLTVVDEGRVSAALHAGQRPALERAPYADAQVLQLGSDR